MICLEYAGPTHAGRPVTDPDSDEYIWARTDWDAPALVHIAPAPPPRTRTRSRPASRRWPCALPPLPPWPDRPPHAMLTDAEALWALARVAQGYHKQHVADALGVTRASVWALAAGKTYKDLPRPPALAIAE